MMCVSGGKTAHQKKKQRIQRTFSVLKQNPVVMLVRCSLMQSKLITMTSHCIMWHDATQAITSHQMTWPSHDLTPQQPSRHQNTSLQRTKHHHHGTAEGSFTAKKWFGHRAGRSPCTWHRWFHTLLEMYDNPWSYSESALVVWSQRWDALRKTLRILHYNFLQLQYVLYMLSLWWIARCSAL